MFRFIIYCRYITLSYCIALRTVSFRLKKRFPTMDHLVHAGIMGQVPRPLALAMCTLSPMAIPYVLCNPYSWVPCNPAP